MTWYRAQEPGLVQGLSAAAGTLETIQALLRDASQAEEGGVTWLFPFLLPSNFLPMLSSDQILLETNWKGSLENRVCPGQPPTTQSRGEGGSRSGPITNWGKASGGKRRREQAGDSILGRGVTCEAPRLERTPHD